MSLFNPFTWFGHQPTNGDDYSAGPHEATPSDYVDEVTIKYPPRSDTEWVENTKASETGPLIVEQYVGRPVWTERNFENFCREAYKMNPVAFRCILLIAQAAASVDLILQKDGKEIEDHDILKLIARPSPKMGQVAFFQAYYSFLLLSGDSYIEAVGPDNKPPRELWHQRPDRMSVVPSSNGLPAAYQFKINDKTVTWPVDGLTGQSKIMHTKEFNPVDEWYGQSRVEAAAFGIDRNNAASAHNKALLDNGARPSGVLVFEPVKMDNGGGVVSAPQSVIKKAEDQLRERHIGPANAGRTLVVSGSVKWEEMGLSPKDMDFEQNKDDAARDICLALGVPPILIVKGDSTFNNISEAKLELYENTVLPLVGLGLTDFNNWLCPLYGDGYQLLPDLDRISALEPRRVARRNSVTDLLEKGVIDDDEAREMLDYGPRLPTAVKKVDATVLTALIGAAEFVGIVPLARYMRSVGLVEPKMTDEQILSSALSIVSGDDENDDNVEDDLPPNADPNGDE